MTLVDERAVAPMRFAHRGRRLRRSAAHRRLVRETRLSAEQLVQPLFVCPGDHVREEITTMPGQYRLSVDEVVGEARRLSEAGISAIMLFGIPEEKDAVGSGAWTDDGITQRAIRALRSASLEMLILGDVCLCEYTTHGHCGLLAGPPDQPTIDNDATLELLGRAAVSLVRAGADIVAPSAMMDGQVAAIRAALDDAGETEAAILAYAAKHASAFYGPFREAAGSTPAFGDRKSYQMDPANGREAMREIEADVAEGADLVMVKPAMPALDLVAAARRLVDVPIAAYQVSGEYAALTAAADRGWLDRRAVAMESLTAIARAGADVIITYFAAEAAAWLAEDRR